MSTLAYAALENARSVSDKGRSTIPPGVSTYVDALAALVPAEALTLHAAILSVTTQTDRGTTQITDPQTLAWSFWGLLALTVGLYAVPRLAKKSKDRLDVVRALIPPLAFVGWMMLQRSTAFDAVMPQLQSAPRTVIALFLGVLLGLLANALAYKADQSEPATT